MKSDKTYAQELKKLADSVDSRYDSDIKASVHATFSAQTHTMQIEAYPFQDPANDAETYEMEQAELIDFWKYERNDGRTNKKR